MDDAIDRIEAAVRRRVDAGDPNVIAMSKRTGGMEKYDRRRRWWTDHHDEFAAALLWRPSNASPSGSPERAMAARA